MPHLNASAADAKSDESKATASKEVQGSPAGKERKVAADPRLSFASASTSQRKKEKGEASWPPSAGGPQGAPPVTSSPYYRAPYGHDPYYYGWPGHATAPALYGGGGRRLFPTSPLTRAADLETNRVDKSPKAKTEESTEEMPRRPAYEEHGYRFPPPARPPFYSSYGAAPYPAYPPQYYDQHRKRPTDNESAHAKRTKASENEKTTRDKTIGENSVKESAIDSGNERESDVSSKEGSKRVISPSSSIDGTPGKPEETKSRKTEHKIDRPTETFSPREPRNPSRDPWYHREGYPYGPAVRGHYPPYYPSPYAGFSQGPPPPGWECYHGPADQRYPHPAYRGHDYRPHPNRPSPYSVAAPIDGSQDPAQREEPTATNEISNHEGTMAAISSPEVSHAAQSHTEEVESPRKIKSVSDWQVAACAEGTAPSANRCVPLEEPIPSKYWGSLEQAEAIVLPDFHRLVNYPDYLIKNYPDYLRKSKSKPTKTAVTGLNADKNGNRHCVMCGQPRLCSASASKPAPSARVKLQNLTKDGEDSIEYDGSDSETTHIIPRQNKGLCTSCDVTVWVIQDQSLEIKWCKGCKNFRPWAAFGDKGMATKCVRCRGRQREKYASQKDRLRANRQNKKAAEKEEKHHEIEAARGLRDLMTADM